MKLTGASDRQIAATLREDPESPVDVSHGQVNIDWHEALRLLEEDYREQATAQRMLANARLERLLAAVWGRAIAPNGPIGAIQEARSIIKDQRALFGLDRELGDPERPITIDVDAEVHIDYRRLTDQELDFLLNLAEQQHIRGPDQIALDSPTPAEGEGAP